MIKRNLLLMLACLCGLGAGAQTADELIIQGRAALADQNLAAAHAKFNAAVNASPNHPTANALLAATRLLVLPQQAGLSNFLNRVGVSSTGRNLYDWTATLPKDSEGETVVPANFKSTEVITVVRTNIMPALAATRTNLARVTQPNFTLTLSPAETTTEAVTIDFGDIQMLRALTYAAEFFGHTLDAHNFSVVANRLKDLIDADELTPQRLLSEYPSLFTKGNANDLAASRLACSNAIQTYFAASAFIRSNRVAGVSHLFELDPVDWDKEDQFRNNLDIARRSLEKPVEADPENGSMVYAGGYFSGATSLRSLLPKFDGTQYVNNSLPDYTFGGVLLNLDACDVEQSLREMFNPNLAGIYFGNVGGGWGGQFAVFVRENLQATLLGGNADAEIGLHAEFTLDEDGYWEFDTAGLHGWGQLYSDGWFEGELSDGINWTWLSGERESGAGSYSSAAGYYTGTWSGGRASGKLRAILTSEGQMSFSQFNSSDVVEDGGAAYFSGGDSFTGVSVNGVDLTGTLNRTARSMAGNLTGSTDSSGTFALSRTAALAGDTPPTITAPPANTTVVAGNKVTLTVTASGSAPLSYRWYSNSVAIPLATSTSLVISNASSTSAGVYSVQVRNLAGSATAQASVTVAAETVKPVVKITAPTSGQSVSNALLMVRGQATDAAGIAEVWCRLNQQAWLPVHGKTEWSTELWLTPGTNVIQAFALDNSGNVSATNTVTFRYVLSAPLTVTIQGKGTLQPNYAGALLEIGKSYTMTATPGTGFTFSQWTGSAVSANRTLQFTMASNLSFTATFIDNVKPTLTYTTPAKGERSSNAVFTVRGKATDNGEVATVHCRVNYGPWVPATGSTNWMATLDLKPGTNYLQAFALDLAGNASTTNSVSLSYVVSDRLTLLTSGPGTVSPNYSNAMLEIGKAYTLTVKPGAGGVFSNWTGGVFTNSAKLTFTMRSNLTLQANFITNPFSIAKGTYNGLFLADEIKQESSGFLSATLSEKGSVSAKIQIAGKPFSFSTTFDASGHASALVIRKQSSPVQFDLQLLTTTPRQIVGVVSNANWTASLRAEKAGFGGTLGTCPLAGKYTLSIAGNISGQALPGGHSYGTLTIDAAGSVKFTGKLAEGSTLSSSAALSKEGAWPLYVSLYSGGGSLFGWITITNSSKGDLRGIVNWFKPVSTSKLYPAGFAVESELSGSKFTPPASGVNLIPWTQGSISFEGGGLHPPFANTITTAARNKILNGSSNSLTLTLNATLGTFTGSAKAPGSATSIPLQGVWLQQWNVGYGFFLGTNASGAISIREQP